MEIYLGKTFRDEVGSFPTQAVKAVWDNFISPIKDGLSVQELQGKFKPSWMIPYPTQSPLIEAMLEFARKHSLYHYHVGHPSYRAGRDPDYPGDESAAIIHVRIENSNFHILRLDVDHPQPFTVPFILSSEPLN